MFRVTNKAPSAGGRAKGLQSDSALTGDYGAPIDVDGANVQDCIRRDAKAPCRSAGGWRSPNPHQALTHRC